VLELPGAGQVLVAVEGAMEVPQFKGPRARIGIYKGEACQNLLELEATALDLEHFEAAQQWLVPPLGSWQRQWQSRPGKANKCYLTTRVVFW
jgi:hypothetical protein